MSIKIRKEDGSFVTLPNIKGETGETGPQGIQGISGENGATFMPSVDENGNISWSNDKGLNNPSTVNIKGPKGDTGPVGDIHITTGTEYETGRIIDNKTEYAIRIDCGSLLSSDTKTIQTSIPNTYTITDYYGIGYWNMINIIPILLPHLGGSIPSIGTMSAIYLNVSYLTGNYRIHITTTNELANLITSSFVTICYTKNEEV